MRSSRLFLVTVMFFALGGGLARAAGGNPGIVPVQASAHGKTYSELAAAWWRWALQTPTPDNAVVDTTGANCASAQTDHVWFLAGSFGTEPVTRTCTVPAGTFLFFPLSNDFYGAFLTDPPDQRTEAFVRSQVECIEGAEVSATIDGVPVNDPAQYLEKSPLFTIHFPEDNVFGVTANDVPELTLEPTVDEGYYLYLNPLPPGEHTLRFTAAPGSSCAEPQDITYHLTVGG